MNKIEYIRFIKSQFEKEATLNNLLPGSSINMDWGELHLILTIANNTLSTPNENNVMDSGNCYLCGEVTTIIREEQYVLLENNIYKKSAWTA